jgi:hypothetical protein
MRRLVLLLAVMAGKVKGFAPQEEEPLSKETHEDMITRR